MVFYAFKNSTIINWHVHYFLCVAFKYVPGPFFSEPLEVKLGKAYLAIKRRPSPLFPPFSTHSSFYRLSLPLALSLPYRPPLALSLLASPRPFLSGWLSQRDYRALTCLHLPPCVGRPLGPMRAESLLSPATIHPESAQALCFLNL